MKLEKFFVCPKCKIKKKLRYLRHIVALIVIWLLCVSNTFLESNHMDSHRLNKVIEANHPLGAVITNPILTIRKAIPSADPDRYDTEYDWAVEEKTISLDLAKTAVVLVDVWNWKYIYPDELFMVGSLINLARRHGIEIIHAAHGRGIAAIAKPIPGELVLPPGELIDPYLKEKGIDTLLYAGFATDVCMLIRNSVGILKLSRRGNYNIILLRDCTNTDREPPVRFAVTRGVEERFSSSDIPAIAKALGDVIPEFSRTPLSSGAEKEHLISDMSLNEKWLTADPRKTALVLINIWENHENDGWRARFKKKISEKIVPLIKFARFKKNKIIYVTNDRPIDKQCLPVKGEPIINNREEFVSFLMSNEINTIVYAGNLTNQVDFLYPLSALEFTRYCGADDTIFLEDCITSFETPETFKYEGMKKGFLLSAVAVYENHHRVITLSSFMDGKQPIVINEICINHCDYNFMELYNSGDVTVDLSRYSLTGAIQFVFPRNSKIAPGEYIVIANNAGVYIGYGYQVFGGTSKMSLRGEGVIQLRNSYGTLIDFVKYDNKAPWPQNPDSTGVCIELADVAKDNSAPENWRSCYFSGTTPGRVNLLTFENK